MTCFFGVFFLVIFLFSNREIRDGIHANQISHKVLNKVWWIREASQIGQTVIPLCQKKFFKTQHGRIPIDPAIFAAIGHRFIAEKGNYKIPTHRSEVMKQETFFFVMNGPNPLFLEYYAVG